MNHNVSYIKLLLVSKHCALTSLDFQVAEHTGAQTLHQLAVDLRLAMHPAAPLQ